MKVGAQLPFLLCMNRSSAHATAVGAGALSRHKILLRSTPKRVFGSHVTQMDHRCAERIIQINAIELHKVWRLVLSACPPAERSLASGSGQGANVKYFAYKNLFVKNLNCTRYCQRVTKIRCSQSHLCTTASAYGFVKNMDSSAPPCKTYRTLQMAEIDLLKDLYAGKCSNNTIHY